MGVALNPAIRHDEGLLRLGIYIVISTVYTHVMSKRLVDIDDATLEAAQAELGTVTIKATINEALRLAGTRRAEVVHEALGRLAAAAPFERDDAWR